MTRSVYLAGPMTGYPEWNFPAFDAAEGQLWEAGYTVHSPASVDRAHGFDPAAPVEDYTLADRHTALRRDLNLILNTVDAVVYLPGSMASEGARLEMSVARAVGLPVLSLTEALQKGPSL